MPADTLLIRALSVNALTTAGLVLVEIVAVVVLAFAIAQIRGLMRHHSAAH